MNFLRNQGVWHVAFGLILVGLAADATGQERRRGERDEERGRSRRPVATNEVERWVDQLADELDHLHEDLLYERAERQLLNDTERTLEAVVHFQQVVRRGADREHLLRDYRQMDRRVHDLLSQLPGSRTSWVRRAASRIEYADEQLHYHLARPGADNRETSRELVVRHAHVLERESRRLQQLTQQFGNLPGRRDRLEGAVNAFADRAEHFHEVAERNADRRHMREDYEELDRTWHIAVEHINQSPAGLWLRRQAQRVNEVHNQLHELVDADGRHATGRHEVSHRDDHDHNREQPSRPQIQFEIPGLGRFRF